MMKMLGLLLMLGLPLTLGGYSVTSNRYSYDQPALVASDQIFHDGFYYGGEPFPQFQSFTLHGRQVPLLKMLKRQVRNFRSGERASVTLVFRSSMPVIIRWFRLAPDFNMGTSEVPNMLPVEGDSAYTLSKMRSGDVTASRLYVNEFTEEFPQSFETIISSVDGQIQYQLHTLIHHITDKDLHDIDSPEWLAVPAPKVHYRETESLKVHCKVFVPTENPKHVNELTMYRVGMMPKNVADPANFKLDFQNVISVHKETSNSAEKNGPTLLQGSRRDIGRGHAIYDVKFRTRNATTFYQGVYLCALERQFDKLFLTSYVTPSGSPSPYPKFPIVDLKSCQKTNYDALNYMVEFQVNQITCLRCLAIGWPTPRVALYDSFNKEILPSDDISVTKYINVADARVAEATYTFRRPSLNTSGKYVCKADNELASHSLGFRILV